MFRSATTGSFCLLIVLPFSGCSSFFTARAIEQFTAGLESGNLEGLESATSAEFQQKALRLKSSSVEALQALSLPTQDGKVVEVQQDGAEARIVTVSMGEGTSPVKYRLKREAAASGSKRWVVDDVVLSQNRPGRETPLTKSVTDQMDLLLTVQEFVTGWRDGSREDARRVLHPQLQSQLTHVSPVHFAQITSEILAGVPADNFRPEARIQPNRATVVLPRREGKLHIDLERLTEGSGEWRVTEASVRNGKEETVTASIIDLARLMGTTAEFLQAYENSNRDALEKLASTEFHRQALMAGDLSSAPLPTMQILAAPFELAESGQRTDVLFDVGANTYLFSLARDDAPSAVQPDGKPSASPVRVEAVTIYEQEGSQIKQLAAVLTVQAVVEVFAEALTSRDAALLAQLSTSDFDAQVWSRLDAPDILGDLPIEGVPNAAPKVAATVFQGQVTEVTVTQGNRALTYVLHSGRGRPLVDDVLIPSNSRPASLKSSLASLVPIYNFARAWETRDRQKLERNSSDSLRRMIWMQTSEVPNLNVALKPYLLRNVRSVKTEGNDQRIELGDEARGAMVRLVPRGRMLVVEDIHLTGPEFAGGRMEFIAALREEATRMPLRSPVARRTPPPGPTTAGRMVPEQQASLLRPEPTGEVNRPAASNLLLRPVAIPGA